jgi:hypothetical protein
MSNQPDRTFPQKIKELKQSGYDVFNATRVSGIFDVGHSTAFNFLNKALSRGIMEKVDLGVYKFVKQEQ